ncbi:MAG: hypothetical protein SF029_24635 [bacterium]|nr:hypothetical protein [bacterium]
MATFSAVTNKGKFQKIFNFYRSGATLRLAFVTDAGVANLAAALDLNTLGQLTEVTGGGYSAGGIALVANDTNFPTITEDDANEIAIVQFSYTLAAVGTAITGIRNAVLCDNNATAANRLVLDFFGISAVDINIPAGSSQTFNFEVRATE